MVASSRDWNEAVDSWSRVRDLGMEAALREAGISEEDNVRALSVDEEADGYLEMFIGLDPELGIATALATVGRGISKLRRLIAPGMGWQMSLNEAAALCVNVSSNTNIENLDLERVKVIGTLEGCALLGNALATNSSIRTLSVRDGGMGSDGVRCLLDVLRSNKTLVSLNLGGNPLLNEGISNVAEFLISNTTIETLDVHDTGFSLEGAKHLSSALARNTGLQYIFLEAEGGAREIVKTLLEPLFLDVGEDVNNSSGPKNTSLKTLQLHFLTSECVDPLTDMIRTNKSLRCLVLSKPVFGHDYLTAADWVEKIIPALKKNGTLKNFQSCHYYDSFHEEVYESVMDLLQNSNTMLEEIDFSTTSLRDRQAQINEELRINKEYRSQLNRLPQTSTTSGRVVLCGYGFAGKTEISRTMKRIEQGSSCAHPLKMVWKRLMQSSPALQQILFGSDSVKELAARTRGFQVVVLQQQPYLKTVWDFAGQKEYYALHDYVFPDVKNSFFLYVCSCRHPPLGSDWKGAIKDERSIEVECEFWFRFLASNSKPGVGRHEAQLPRVKFVLTKTDTLRSPEQIISIAKQVVLKLKVVFKDVLNLCQHIEVVNAHSSSDVQRLLDTSNQNLEEMLVHQKEYAVCEEVRGLLEGWSLRNPLKPVLSLEEFFELCKGKVATDQVPNAGWKIILAYLNDLGEIIYPKNNDFIVTNPSWFGIDVLGSLITAFKAADHRQTRFSKWIGNRIEFCKLRHSQGFVEWDDMKDHLERSLQSMDLRQSIPPQRLINLMIELEMCFQNHQEDAEETDAEEEDDMNPGETNREADAAANQMECRLFLPAIFDDENEIAAKGERKLEWKVEQFGHYEYLGRRLECLNKSTTFMTPGFFPRLQVHLRNYIHRRGWTKQLGFEVGRNLIRFSTSGTEVCVEYAGEMYNFIDILVRSTEPHAKALQIVERHVVNTIRTFCASPQGCQGVSLVESVIRPVCVRDLHLCKDREAHAVLVDRLKQKLAWDEGYKHTWRERIEHVSDTDRAFDLLEGEGSYDRIRRSRGDVGLAPNRNSNSTPGASSRTSYPAALPMLIYPTIEDVGMMRKFETSLNPTKVIPIKLHLLCDHKDGSHKVAGQPGRTVKLNASGGGVDVPLAKLAVTLLWAGVGAAAAVVGASVVVPLVDRWIESLFTVPEMPGLNGETLRQIIDTSGHRSSSSAVSENEILKSLEKYWKCDPRTQGLKELLKLEDGTSFWNDFLLRKVVYTEAAHEHENRIGWVCDKHYRDGLNQGILRSEPH